MIVLRGLVPRNEFRGSEVSRVQGTPDDIWLYLSRPLDSGTLSASEFIPWRKLGRTDK